MTFGLELVAVFFLGQFSSTLDWSGLKPNRTAFLEVVSTGGLRPRELIDAVRQAA